MPAEYFTLTMKIRIDTDGYASEYGIDATESVDDARDHLSKVAAEMIDRLGVAEVVEVNGKVLRSCGDPHLDDRCELAPGHKGNHKAEDDRRKKVWNNRGVATVTTYRS